MSKRLQVLVSESEMVDIQCFAKRDRLTVGEWVRQTLRNARDRQPVNEPDRKIKAIRQAVQYDFPAADIADMLSEIERGYGH